MGIAHAHTRRRPSVVGHLPQADSHAAEPQPVPRTWRAEVATTGSRVERRVRAAPSGDRRRLTAPCLRLRSLRRLDAVAARDYVTAYLAAVMSADDAAAFEADQFQWTLHRVSMNQIQLLRAVEIDPATIRHYSSLLADGARLPPLIGLGGDGDNATHGVLLCDGYHRAMAMRDAGMKYVWMWLATGSWVMTGPDSRGARTA